MVLSGSCPSAIRMVYGRLSRRQTATDSYMRPCEIRKIDQESEVNKMEQLLFNEKRARTELYNINEDWAEQNGSFQGLS